MTILISKVNQLGDAVVFLPVLQHLRQQLPMANLIVVTSPVAAPLFEACVTGIEIMTVATSDFNSSWKRPWQLVKSLRDWRLQRPDVALFSTDQGNVARLLAFASGAGRRFGPAQPWMPMTGLLNRAVDYDLRIPVAVQNWLIYRAFAAEEGFAGPDLPPCPDITAMLTDWPGSYDVVIHPGASRAYKRWPLESHVALASRLAKCYRVGWIDDEQSVDLPASVERLKTSNLGELITVLHRSRLFVGHNSGPMNLVSALGIRSIIFNGPSVDHWDPYWHAERFTLLKDPHLKCQPCDLLTRPVNECQNAASPMACMSRWSVEAVEAMCHDALAEST